MEPEAGAIHPIKLYDVDPQAWLAGVLARLPDYPANKIADLLPCNWQTARLALAA
jgi:transposase